MSMLSFHISKTRLICFLLSLLKLNLTSEAAPTFLYNDCSGNATFSPNSTFQRNLKSLLSSLSSNSTRGNRFYNLTVSSDSDDMVYGLFLCRGGATKDMCRDCVGTAGKDVVQRCSMEKAAIISYEECMLRYSDENFFGKLELKPAVQLVNAENVSQQEQFKELLERITRNITAMIANDRSGRRLAIVESPFTSNETVYALGQCTQDLSASDCNKCLKESFSYFLPGCCGIRLGGRLIFPSCNFRYELYPFYQGAVSASSPPGPGSKGKRKLSSGKIIGIVAASVACLVLLIMAICLLSQKTRKKYNNEVETKYIKQEE